jgi:hypothetical protein
VTYFCYLFTHDAGAAHFEVLAGESLADAERDAARLLQDHPRSDSAEIWADDALVLRVRRAAN